MRDLIQKPIYENLPKTGYLVSKEEKKEKIYKNESHIHKQGPLSGVKAGAHRLYNDILTYFPKGFAGSKNSDFYEYLSLGMVPYIIGSAMLIAVYSAANKSYHAQSANAAGAVAKRMGAGVVLYGIGKWLSKKISHKLIKGSTGVDLDMKYVNKVNELPENGSDKGITRIQYPGVFDSADFPRKDLIALDNELNYDNVYAYEDKIAKKAGFKDRLNAPNQTMWPKIRELKVRATALENISKYIMAATGVALGSQSAFDDLKLLKKNPVKVPLLQGTNFNQAKDATNKISNGKVILSNIAHNVSATFKDIQTGFSNAFASVKDAKDGFKNAFDVLKNRNGMTFKEAWQKASLHLPKVKGNLEVIKRAFSELWNSPNGRNAVTKHYGKVLISASIVSTLLSWLIPAINFKKNPETMKSRVDGKKDYEVC